MSNKFRITLSSATYGRAQSALAFAVARNADLERSAAARGDATAAEKFRRMKDEYAAAYAETMDAIATAGLAKKAVAK